MHRVFSAFRRPSSFAVRIVLACSQLLSGAVGYAEQPGQSLEISRPIRSWEFVSAVGKRAGLFGNEQGTLEAWVYPLKILRDFHVRFHVGGAIVPAEALARTLIVHPESSTIVYAGDVFSVRETLFAPVRDAGAIVAFEVHSTEPLEIEATFNRDFQLEWPAAFGAVNEEWDANLHAFRFGEESGRFEALVGSPSAVRVSEELSTNYVSSRQDSMLLGVTAKGVVETKLIVVAARFDGRESLNQLYNHLAKDYPELLRSSATYYRDYLDRTIGLKLPDERIEKAYEWAKVSMLQGVVENPFLGEGLIAGYNKSGDDLRPGFAWFFGRDAEWTSLALDAEGDFSTSRSALEFLSKYQRADGKIPHEVSQSASFLDWFNKTPYAYAAADATPLFIIAVNEYVTHSGDIEFVQQNWESLWRAYGFLRSTYDAQGFAQNSGVGSGWIEGGPLYPVRTELYQASLGVEAGHALSHLARLLGKEDLAKELEQAFERQQPLLEKAFWSPEQKIYGYAIDTRNHRIDIPSVLATVPMWFQLLNQDQARSMIQQLAGPDEQTDWGMRIISAHDPKYDPGGYHFGTVWPLFTGWASVGEYRYHRALPAYSNLQANALLALDGSLGHVSEVLSGDYYQTLSTGTPHQIWSAAMVVDPLLSGLLGLHADAPDCHLNFVPHVPADWNAFSVSNVRVGPVALNLNYQRTPGSILLEVQSTGAGKCSLEFSPAMSLRAKITRVHLNRRPLPFHIEANAADQHVTVSFPISGDHNTVEISMKDNFEISESATLPALGGTSHGLRVLAESWTPARDSLSLLLSGAAGETYEFAAWNPGQIISVQGAELEKGTSQVANVRVQLPASEPGTDPRAEVIFHFAAR
jgi:glycogen debranching enzyme